MTWNEGNPKVGNTIAADIADISENFQHNTDTSGSVNDIAASTTLTTPTLTTPTLTSPVVNTGISAINFFPVV